MNNILAFASPNMAERLKKLIEQIDQDKSVAPYIAFANQFPSLLIKEVMVSLYLISEQGGIEVYMPQFQKSFDALSTQKRQADKEQRLSTLNTLCFLPLVGSGACLFIFQPVLRLVLLHRGRNGAGDPLVFIFPCFFCHSPLLFCRRPPEMYLISVILHQGTGGIKLPGRYAAQKKRRRGSQSRSFLL